MDSKPNLLEARPLFIAFSEKQIGVDIALNTEGQPLKSMSHLLSNQLAHSGNTASNGPQKHFNGAGGGIIPAEGNWFINNPAELAGFDIGARILAARGGQ